METVEEVQFRCTRGGVKQLASLFGTYYLALPGHAEEDVGLTGP